MKKDYKTPEIETLQVETEKMVCTSRDDYELATWTIILGDGE